MRVRTDCGQRTFFRVQCSATLGLMAMIGQGRKNMCMDRHLQIKELKLGGLS